MIKDEKLDSVSGGGIRKYEEMVRQMFSEGKTPNQILQVLQVERDSVSGGYSDKARALAVNASNGTGYDKIQYEVKAIDTVMQRLQQGAYPKRSWQ